MIRSWRGWEEKCCKVLEKMMYTAFGDECTYQHLTGVRFPCAKASFQKVPEINNVARHDVNSLHSFLHLQSSSFMFALLSKTGPRAGNSYICSSCILKSLQALDVPIPILSREYSTSKKTSSSKDAKLNAKSAEDVKANAATPKGGPPPKNPPTSRPPSNTPRPKAQKRMIDRRKERLAILKAARPDASFKLLLKIYRAELERESSTRDVALQPTVDKTQDGATVPKKQVAKKLSGEDVKLGDLDGDGGSVSKKRKVKQKTTAKMGSGEASGDGIEIEKNYIAESADISATATTRRKNPGKRTRMAAKRAAAKGSGPTEAVDGEAAIPSSSQASLKKKKAKTAARSDGTGNAIPSDMQGETFTKKKKQTSKVLASSASGIPQRPKSTSDVRPEKKKTKTTAALKVIAGDEVTLGDLGEDLPSKKGKKAARENALDTPKAVKPTLKTDTDVENTPHFRKVSSEQRAMKHLAVRAAMQGFKRAEAKGSRKQKKGLQIVSQMPYLKGQSEGMKTKFDCVDTSTVGIKGRRPLVPEMDRRGSIKRSWRQFQEA